MVTDIYNFIKNGKLLDYELGNDLDTSILKVLAEHNDDYFKYIYTEVAVIKLMENKICSVKINFIENSTILINGQVINTDSTFEGIKQVLDNNNIGWLFYQRYSFAGQIAILTEGGVLLIFLKENIINSKIYLDNIILTEETERVGEFKFIDRISNRTYNLSE